MYRLSNSIPYLVNRVGTLLGDVAGRLLQPYEITLPMFRVMACLCERDGQRLGELAAFASIDASTLSRLIGTMVSRQLVSRSRSETSGRAVEITLTSRGRELTEKLMQITSEYEDRALQGFSDAHVTRLKQDLAHMYANLESLERGGYDGLMSEGLA